MSRENKKKAVADFHKENIMVASEKLFTAKGFAQTTIDDISKASEYSRRTIYAYYHSKDDILHHIIEKGLIILKQDVESFIRLNEDFVSTFEEIFKAMVKYQTEYPHSANSVNSANLSNLNSNEVSETVKHILLLGTEINDMLSSFIETGKRNEVVREDVIPSLTVYVLWSSMTALITLVKTKGMFISKQFSISDSEILEYGFKQLINSILEIKI